MGASASRPNEPYNPYAPQQHAVYPVTATYTNSKASRKYKDLDATSNNSVAYYAQPPYQNIIPSAQYPIVYQNGQAGYYVYPQQISSQDSQSPPLILSNPQSPPASTPVNDELQARSSSNGGHREFRGEPAADLPSISQPLPASVEQSAPAVANRRRSSSPLAHPLPESPHPVLLPGENLSTARDESPLRHRPDQEERPRSPLERPLPALPQDIYETEQYRSLTQGPGALRGGTIQVYPEGWFEKRDIRKKPKGILRSFSTTAPSRPREPQRRDSAPASRMDALNERSSYRPSHNLQRSTSHVPDSPQGYHGSPMPYSSMSSKLPPMGPPPPPITFDKHSGLSHISPHKILYKDKLYPTAFHLLEAHRFLGSRNDLAERIRQAESVRDVYTMSAALNRQSRQDWAEVILDKMDDVQCMKFRQHPDLRGQLLSTGTADLIFADRSDPFWGDGPLGHGSNELGKSLMRVREKLLYGDVKEEKKWSSMITKILG